MTRAMKENTPFRIAFCVLCHKYTPVLAELVHQLDAPGNGLFIHVDGKADIGAFAALGKTGRVCFVEPRTKVYWGGIRHGRKYAPAFLGDTRRGFPLRRPDFGRHPAVIPCRNDTYGTPGSLCPGTAVHFGQSVHHPRRGRPDTPEEVLPRQIDLRPPLAADRHEMHHACGQPFFRPAPARWRKAASGLRLRIVCAISSSITSLHTRTLSLHFGTAMQPMNYFSIRCSATPRLPGTTRIIRLSMPTGRTPGHTRKHCPQATCPNCPCSSRGGGGKFPAFRPQVRRRAGHRPLPRNPVRAGN